MTGLFFRDIGSGEAVVLVHGFCESHALWDEFSLKLSDSYRVISIDLPGFGKSPLPSVPFSIDDVASIVNEQLETMGLAPCIIVGHSLGGYVGLSLVAQRPAAFRGMVLFHSTALADTQEKKLNTLHTFTLCCM